MSVEETEKPKSAPEAPPPLGETIRDLEERFAPKIEEAKEQLSLINGKMKGFIREHPGTSLLAAVGLGYLIGRLASRK